jgi:tetratricopeptide (TPR) repeat protein
MILRRRYWLLFVLVYATIFAALLPAACRKGDMKQTGRDLLERGEYGQAARRLELYVDAEPGDVEGRVLLGRAYLALEDFRDAHAQFEAALDLSPGEPSAVDGNARTYRAEVLRYLERGHLERARELLDEATADLADRLPDHPRPSLLHQWIGNFRLLRFNTHVRTIQELLEETFEPEDVRRIQALVYRFILTPVESEETVRAALVSDLSRNPSFGGIEALNREMVEAKESFRATVMNLEKALEEDPNLSTAAFALAAIHLQVGRIDQARAACEALLAIPATGPDAATIREDQLQGHLAMADILLRQGNRLGALEELRGVAASGMLDEAQSLEVLRRLCHLEAQLARYEDLEGSVAKILEEDPDDLTARIYEGLVALYRHNDPHRAIRILRDFPLALTLRFPLALEALARAEMEAGDPPAAIETLNRLILENPKLVSAHALRAEAYRRNGWLDAAEQECRGILADFPTDTAVQETLRLTFGQMIDAEGTEVAGIDEAMSRLRRNRNDQGVRFRLIELLEQEGRIGEAISEGRVLVDAFPRNPIPRILLGRLLGRAGQTAEARREYQMAHRILPLLPDGLVGEASVLLREASYQDAIDRLREARKLVPESPEVLLLLGRCEIARGNAKAAKAILTGAGHRPALAKLAPDHPGVRVLDAAVVRDLGDPREALRRLDPIVENETGPVALEARLARIRCLEALGIPFDTVAELFPDGALPEAASIRDIPTEQAVVRVFGSILSEGSPEPVFEFLDRFSGGPRTLEGKLIAVLAEHMAGCGEREAAAALCRRGLQISRNHPDLNRTLGLLLADRGQEAAATPFLGRAVRERPTDTGTQLRLATILMNEGKGIQALKSLQRLLKFAPDLSEAWQRLAYLVDPRRSAAIMHPKIRRTLAKMSRGGRSIPVAARIILFRQLGGEESIPAQREAAFRFGVSFLHLTDRLSRSLAPTRLLTHAVPPKGRARRASGTPAYLSRSDRRLLAATLLANGLPQFGLWTATRMDPWETLSDIERADRILIATLLLDLGDVEAARLLVDRMLEQDPGDETLESLRLWTLLEARSFDEVQDWIEQQAAPADRATLRHLGRIIDEASDLPISPPKTAARIELLDDYPALWIEAAKEARDFAQYVPSNPLPYHLWARTLDLQGDPRTAVEVLREGIQRSPTNVTTVLAAVQVLERGDTDKGLREAARILREGLDFNPRSVALLSASVEIDLKRHRKQPDLASAIRTLGLALGYAPDDPDASVELVARIHRRLGKLLATRDASDEAIDHFRRAIELDPDELPHREALADLLLREKRFDEAAREGEEMIESFPERSEGWMVRCRALKAAGRSEETARLLQDFLQRFPYHPAAYALSGDLVEDAGMPDRALAWYGRAITLDPSLWMVHERRAKLRLAALAQAPPERRSEAERRALDDLRECLAVLPAQASEERAWIVRECLLLLEELEDPEETIRLGRAYGEAIDRDAVALASLGRAYITLQRVDDAERVLTRALEVDAENPRAHFYLGEAFRLRSATKEARKQYQRAVEIGTPFEELQEAQKRLQGLGPTRRPVRR